MAQQSSFYITDGVTRTYPSSKHIASKQHVAVYFQSVTTSTWSIIEQTLYDLVNNSIVFTDAPDPALYSQIEIRVADTAAELTESPSDIATVAGAIADVTTVAGSITAVETVSSNTASVTTVSGSIANVNTVATNVANVNTVATNIASVNTVAANIVDVSSVADTIVPNIAEILLADTNATTATTQAGIATTKAGEASTSATNAQLSAWEAEAEKMTADSYATEAEDVLVKVYTSNGDGTFTATPTTEYSALHWAAKSVLAAQGDAVNISYDNATSGLTATNVQTAIDEIDGRLDTVEITKNQFTTSIVFEGATANDFETTLTVTDPTADRVVTIPDRTFTMAGTDEIAGMITTEGFLHIQDQKASGIVGGTFTSGAWQTRTLNTVLTNTISGASLASNVITLPAGTYLVEAIAPAYAVDAHKVKILNDTDSTDILIGTSERANSSSPFPSTSSRVSGVFTINSEKNIKLMHRCQTSGNNTGFGTTSNFGVVEVYSDIKIWKVG